MKSIVLISLPFAFLLPFGCGPSETDSTDEAGAVPDHDTRVELIFVDAGTASAQEADTDTIVEALPIDTPPIETQPAPTAADETGGDDLLSFDAEGKFTVQVGTFKNSAVASRRVRELAGLGYPAYAVGHPAGEQVRVRIGYFGSKAEADRFGLRFCRDHGGAYWVDRRSAKKVATR